MDEIPVQDQRSTRRIAPLEGNAAELDNTNRVPESSAGPLLSPTITSSNRNRPLTRCPANFWRFSRISESWMIFSHLPVSASPARLRMRYSGHAGRFFLQRTANSVLFGCLSQKVHPSFHIHRFHLRRPSAVSLEVCLKFTASANAATRSHSSGKKEAFLSRIPAFDQLAHHNVARHHFPSAAMDLELHPRV